MDVLITNLPFIIALVYLIVMIVVSFKRGFAKEVCSLVALFVATIIVMLIAFAIRAYFSQERIVFVITLILLFLLFVLYKIVDLFLTSLKIISKLPVIRLVDKPLGIIVGVAEVILTVWAVYCVITVWNTGAFEGWIMNCVKNNFVMKLLYEYNYMYKLVGKIYGAISGVDVFGALGM